MAEQTQPESGRGFADRLKAGFERWRTGGGPAAPAPPLSRGRRIWVWVLVVLATILLVVSALTVWVKRQALDPNNWANTSEKLLENDEVRGELSQYLVDQVYANVDVSARLSARLPGQAQGLAAPLAVGLQQLAVRAADALLQRPRVQQLWKEVNRRAVRDLVDILDGDTVRGVRAEDSKLILDLQPVARDIAGRLGVADRLPADAGQLVILESDQVKAAQNGLKALRVLTVFLALVVLFLYALAVYLARGRRRQTLRAVGWSLVVAGVVLLVVRRLAGHFLVDALTEDNTSVRSAGNSAWLIGTDLLKDLAVLILVLGALIVVATWLAGPSRWATAVRRWLAPHLRQRPWIVVGAVVLAFLLFMLWGPSAGGRSFWGVLALFVLVLIGVDALRRQTLREFPEEAGAGPGLTPGAGATPT